MLTLPASYLSLSAFMPKSLALAPHPSPPGFTQPTPGHFGQPGTIQEPPSGDVAGLELHA